MASHHRRLYVYVHLDRINLDRCSCLDHIGAGSAHPQLFRCFPSPVNFPPGLRFWSLSYGPLSEVYGRVAVLQLANMFYLAFNTACGFCQSARQLIAFRFLAGIGGR